LFKIISKYLTCSQRLTGSENRKLSEWTTKTDKITAGDWCLEIGRPFMIHCDYVRSEITQRAAVYTMAPETESDSAIKHHSCVRPTG